MTGGVDLVLVSRWPFDPLLHKPWMVRQHRLGFLLLLLENKTNLKQGHTALGIPLCQDTTTTYCVFLLGQAQYLEGC